MRKRLILLVAALIAMTFLAGTSEAASDLPAKTKVKEFKAKTDAGQITISGRLSSPSTTCASGRFITVYEITEAGYISRLSLVTAGDGDFTVVLSVTPGQRFFVDAASNIDCRQALSKIAKAK